MLKKILMAFALGVFAYSVAQAAFSEQLYRGLRHSQVSELQKFLSQYPDLYPEKLVTGYFGPLTESAVQRFQVKYNVVQFGNPETTGFGRVGPKTFFKLNEVGLASEVNRVPPVVEVEKPIGQVAPTGDVLPTCRVRRVPSDYSTIQAAVDAACPGDEVRIEPGFYRESVVVGKNNLKIIGESKTVLSSGNSPAISLGRDINSIEIHDLTVEMDYQTTGIDLSVSEGEANVLISGVTVKNALSGIVLFGSKGSFKLSKNLIIGSKKFGVLDGVSGLAISVLENNTFTDNDIGYYVDASTGKHRLLNSIIVSNRTYGVAFSSNSADKEQDILTVYYTNVWNNKTKDYFSNRRNEQFTPPGGNNYSTDPLFAALGDYHLRRPSLMIDGGDPNSSKDPDDTRADVGAFWFDQRVAKNDLDLLLSNLLGLFLSFFQ